MPGADFMVVDFTTGEPLPLGEAGEIVVRGPSLLTRYWKSTAAVLRDGRLHTGHREPRREGPRDRTPRQFLMAATGKIKMAELRPAVVRAAQ
ncbi:hypothetical protein ACFZBE_30215 [Streptomyces sp. NPDC008061]|uniref:hypothetical protein n=1 Tax=Streptomyces sp. NPDC008061 TaxID=3364805 RepID=UPI0036E8BE82